MSVLSNDGRQCHVVLHHRSQVQKVPVVLSSAPYQDPSFESSGKEKTRQETKETANRSLGHPQQGQDTDKLRQLSLVNQTILFSALESLMLVTDRMNRFAQMLYQQSDSLALYRSFRHLYESFSACSMSLHKFQPSDQVAERQKRQLVESQMRLLSRVEERVAPIADSELQDIVEENRNLRMMLRKYEERLQNIESNSVRGTRAVRSEPEASEAYADYFDIKEENARLREELRQQQAIQAANNQEFAVTIQKYNGLLFAQRQQLQRMQIHSPRNNTLETAIVQLKAELELYKEQRFKDQLLIENMTRKLRAQQPPKRIHTRDRTSERFDRPAMTRTLSSTLQQVK